MEGQLLSTCKCRNCKKQLPLACFGTRKFRGEIVPVQACFQCMAHTNKLKRASDKTPNAHASRAKTIQKYVKTDGYGATMKRYDKSEKNVARKKRANASDAHKRGKAKHRASEKYAQTTASYKASDRHKEVRAAEYKRTHSDPGRHLEHAIGVVMGHMLDGQRDTSKKVIAASGFANADELWTHLQSTFEDGMTIKNHGRYIKGGPRVWHIGHRIARRHFDPKTHTEDMKRCWSPANLFAQWADENMSAGTKLPLLSVLMQLNGCWPTGWGGELPKGVQVV